LGERVGEGHAGLADLGLERVPGLFGVGGVVGVLLEKVVQQLLEVGLGLEQGVLGLAQVAETQVRLATASVQLAQEEVVRVLHDLDDGDGCLQLLDGEFEIAHRRQLSSLVEMNIGQQIQPLVRIRLMRFLVFTHGLKLIQNRNTMSLLQVFRRRYDTENRQRVIVVEV